ncbi:tryptophan synthase subunit alpha [Thalassotalea sp. HSM 43]|uniref:tryptophan synthase subunit alpha n=1 Tax=Thalassotalea sp. HSM 43 TaxID=2552945 RepID=UPI001080FB3C|nr:tryptophan synthase subunit alpha [Thalassotalea sp. HSM 43]QBY05331.1 tryptophan synthase subunit alpha [Thalassotalea sp. HSM 43]
MTEVSQLGQRYQDMFDKLEQQQQGAFIPFVTIGDPNKEQSIAIIKTLIDNGADALELGIPYSDPSADGLTIQLAAKRALDAGINTDICIDILQQVRAYAPHIPIGLLLYTNLVFARGIDSFYADMKHAGVDSVLIADVPMRESKPFETAAAKHGIAPIFIAPPNASDETLQQVAAHCKGYTYVLSRAGVTGTEVKANMPGKELIDTLRQYHAPAPVLGFGISKPQQVSEAMNNGADGAISGSAVVNIIAENLDDNPMMLDALSRFVKDMKAAS